ncbi:MAG: S1 RNA-binding domain-containing protein [Planctomycetes bacterium]|nr:S1 RNA-binding domain-containing protein [Planctomycetota bacterium]
MHGCLVSLPPATAVRPVSRSESQITGRQFQMDRCLNCNALVPSDNQFHDWESLCLTCGNLTWLAPGGDVQCAVSKLTQFGVFVDLGDRVQGLIHISELANTRIEHPLEVVSEDYLVTAKVLRVDVTDRKISLSLKRVHGG